MKNYTEMTLALAGICQVASLINQLAMKGEVEDQDAFETSINSLLHINPKDTLSIFGGQAQHLRLGLSTLVEQLTQLDDKNVMIYWGSLLGLENKLSNNIEAKRLLAQRIARLPEQLNYYGVLDERMLSVIANIYTDVVSPLGRKINIIGSAFHLQQQYIQDKIRACLLAGIRSAVLWRQVGGGKWILLFSRRKLVETARSIYSTF